MKYFDCHTHVNFAAFKDDRAEAIKRAQDAGVSMNVVGTQLDTSLSAVELAEKYGNVYATIGLHPIHTSKSFHDAQELGPSFAKATTGKRREEGFTSRGEIFNPKVYEDLAKHPLVIAIGECGLDYYRCDESTKVVQKDVFLEHIELANKAGKPLMLHIRNAYEDALLLLKAHAKVKGNVHFFAGDWDTAKKFLGLGFTLSFTGVITFTHDYDEVVKNAPLESILSETDAPYVAPVPHRGKRNEPLYVQEVVKAIARIRGKDVGKVREQLLSNARRVFGLK